VIALNRTHDASVRSWLEPANAPKADFPIQNLPFGVFRSRSDREPARCGVAVGDCILDVSKVPEAFHSTVHGAVTACGQDSLNELMALSPSALCAFRAQIFDLLAQGNTKGQRLFERVLVPIEEAELLMPVRVAGYTDFFASIHHATNAGRLFRPDQPLLPNYKYVPVGYNGRAASVQLDSVAVQRPRGQLRKPGTDAPSYAPCEQLDYEVELGLFVGQGSERGIPVPVRNGWNHVFGVCLLNDWSARDIQAWEAQPLGPFLAKGFATSISPWLVTAEALAPFRQRAAVRPKGDPAPLPHLWDNDDQENGALRVEIEAYLRTKQMRERGMPAHQLSHSDSNSLYWTPAQLLAHHTSNGSFLQTADLIGTGTISGADEGSEGTLLEITQGGRKALTLPTGEERRFLDDGDEVTLRARCERPGFVSIGFGSCRSVVLPAPLGVG
jgi:fumarylacetoacetase